MMQQPPWWAFAVMQVGKYFLFAGLAYLLFYSIQKQRWGHKKIQPASPARRQSYQPKQKSAVQIATPFPEIENPE
jgi:hypothetical protein